jgi:hypothetical protein
LPLSSKLSTMSYQLSTGAPAPGIQDPLTNN